MTTSTELTPAEITQAKTDIVHQMLLDICDRLRWQDIPQRYVAQWNQLYEAQEKLANGADSE